MSEAACIPATGEPVRPPTTAGEPQPQVGSLLASYQSRFFGSANRLFAWLLMAQWGLVTLIAALTGQGSGSGATIGVNAAIGALLTLPALVMMRRSPFALATRVSVALAQVGFGLLVVHLTAGRPEAQFHGLVSLALLFLYRDWRILAVAAAAVMAHHVLSAIFWADALPAGYARPASVATHAAWLFCECAALGWSCLASQREMREICRRQDENQRLLDSLEQRARDRTRDLEREMEARARTAEELQQNEQHYRSLVATIPIGLFETTRSGAVKFANPYLLRLVGLPALSDPTAVSLADGRILPQHERERLWSQLESEKEVRGFATTLQHADGSLFEVLINARLRATAPGAELACEGTVEDVTGRKRAERELEALHSQLVLASRQAGMAEVATGVLHNVGNVLTSVNLIVHDVQDRLKTTRLSHLQRVVDVLQREKAQLAEFFAAGGQGGQLPDFLDKLNQHLAAENRQLLADVEGLVRHFEHIREIIVTQQGSAQLFGVTETLAPAQLFEDALRLNADTLARYHIAVARAFEPVGTIEADRHKVLQILVNLLKSAKDALQPIPAAERRIRVAVTRTEGGAVAFSVQDNGPGLAAPDLTRIFQHGFASKANGHGFGLHSSVLAAREMGGDLTATSGGAGQGATFTLTLPGAGKARS